MRPKRKREKCRRGDFLWGLVFAFINIKLYFWCIFFQLASPQSFLTLQQAAGSHTGQSQMITLPITNAAGQQQLLTIPVTLAQGQGGVQFLIPTSGGLFAANISSLTPVSPQVGLNRHITTKNCRWRIPRVRNIITTIFASWRTFFKVPVIWKLCYDWNNEYALKHNTVHTSVAVLTAM